MRSSFRANTIFDQIPVSSASSTVDFGNVDDVIVLAKKLFAKANDLGLCVSGASRQSGEAARLIGETSVWVNFVKKNILSYPAAKALILADAFELMHRIAFLQPADTAFINGIILRAFDAYIHGDTSVDEYVLYRAVRSAVSRKDKVFFGRPLEWICRCEERWYNEAKAGFRRSSLSDYDVVSRVTVLLQTDLFVFEGERQLSFKRMLAKGTRYYLTQRESDSESTLLAKEMCSRISSQFLDD